MPISRRRATSIAEKIAAAQTTVKQGQGFGQYMTTCDTCLCGDHKYRGRVCKHMVFVRERAEQERAKEASIAETARLCQAMHDFF